MISEDENRNGSHNRIGLQICTLDDGQALSPSSSCTTFSPFTLLPTELRLSIWSHSIQPRILVFSRAQRGEKPSRHQETRRGRIQASNTTVPALLQINRESRDLALQYYKLAFSWDVSERPGTTTAASTLIPAPARIYFNFALDALYLTDEVEAEGLSGFSHHLVSFLPWADTRQVRHVACDIRDLGYPIQDSSYISVCLHRLVERFPSAVRILLTMREGDEKEIAVIPRILGLDNVIQEIWSSWLGGVTVTDIKMADKQILMVSEENLAEVVRSGC